MLCVSAVFAVGRCLSVCPSVRPSVRLFVTLVYCMPCRRYRQTFLSGLSAWLPHRSSFWPPAPVSNTKGNPFSGGGDKRGGKNCDFRQIAIYLGNGTRYLTYRIACWPWLTSKRVARFVSDSWVSCSQCNWPYVWLITQRTAPAWPVATYRRRQTRSS